MKKIYRLVLINFIGSFTVTFFIAIFVFLMFFVFAYIDEFVGKNIGVLPLVKLFFYFSLNTIPRALPLAILLASLMTLGNMTEHYEVSAMKSAGISFTKLSSPLLIFSILMSAFLFSFSNYTLPYTNLKMQSLLMSIRSSKPALLFKEGAFNNELRGFSIRIEKMDEGGKSFRDILIYDHSSSEGNTTVLHAERGEILEMGEKGQLIFRLYKGNSYKEISDSGEVSANNNLVRDSFEERIIRFNVSDFMMKSVDENGLRKDYAMLNLEQLQVFIDSLKTNILLNKEVIREQKIALDKIKKDTLNVSPQEFSNILDTAVARSRNIKLTLSEAEEQVEVDESYIVKYTVEWHKRLAFPFACIVMFLIGAPLGYIVKKGGLGMPVVISVVLFIIFHTLSIAGEKLAEDEMIPEWQGIWLAVMILLPISLFIFYKASRDSSLLSITLPKWKMNS
ncbi:MAG: LptF/LptG family permease [Bacteroidota bacterium]|nr:LptF/LptG family permease [Bacteroidota bacterium]